MKLILQDKTHHDNITTVTNMNINKIRNSEYFAGVIDSCNCDNVLFPSQYKDVFNI